jgi:hypothetical protein
MVGGLDGRVGENILAYISKQLDKGIEIVILLPPTLLLFVYLSVRSLFLSASHPSINYIKKSNIHFAIMSN